MKSLNEDLKSGQLKQLYLLYGEEVYLKRQYKERIVKTMFPDGDTFNYSYYEGKGLNPKEIIDLAETLPFFAEYRLIVLENTGFLKNACPELADYVKQLPETTRMLFVENELDKRGKLFKTIKDKGSVVEFARQDERTLIRWILGIVKKEEKQMTEAAAAYFLSKVGNDMENIQKELEKLLCYTWNDAEVTMKEIDEVCVSQISNHIFDMVDAVAGKQQRKALDYYYELLALKEPPMRILFLLTRQFRILLQIKELESEGVTPKEMASKVGILPFLVGKYRAQAKPFTMKELREILEAGVNAEEDVKTGKIGDILSVEMFLIRYSSNK